MTVNEAEVLISAFEILLKLISALQKNPQSDKYRQFWKTNKHVKSKLLVLEPAGSVISLIEAIGWTHHNE